MPRQRHETIGIKGIHPNAPAYRKSDRLEQSTNISYGIWHDPGLRTRFQISLPGSVRWKLLWPVWQRLGWKHAEQSSRAARSSISFLIWSATPRISLCIISEFSSLPTGQGDFLLPTINRLLSAYRQAPEHDRQNVVTDLADCIRAVELHHASYAETRTLVLKNSLRGSGINASESEALCCAWLVQGDFLLVPLEGEFTHVVGNPPYLRAGDGPRCVDGRYRRRFSTIFDRADIYVPFIERSLSLLAPQGQLGFICADRWMKNRYGGPYGASSLEKFNLKAFVDMVDTAAFHSEVIAYPAIVVISREEPGATRVAFRPKINADELRTLASTMTATKLRTNCGVTEISGVATDAEPWMLDAPDQLALVRRLEGEFPTLEEAGCEGWYWRGNRCR